MPIAHQLIISRELQDRISLPYSLISLNVFNGLRLKDIETTVDPTFFAMRLLLEVNDVIMIEHEPSESGRRQD